MASSHSCATAHLKRAGGLLQGLTLDFKRKRQNTPTRDEPTPVFRPFIVREHAPPPKREPTRQVPKKTTKHELTPQLQATKNPQSAKRPVTLNGRLLVSVFNEHYVGRTDVAQSVYSFVSERLQRPRLNTGEKPLLLLQGPHGCGKATLVRHVGRLMGGRKILSFQDEDMMGDKEFQTCLWRIMTNKPIQDGRPVVLLTGIDGWPRKRLLLFIKMMEGLQGKKVHKAKGRGKGKTSVSDQVTRKSTGGRKLLTAQDSRQNELLNTVCNPIVATISDTYFRERKDVYRVSEVVKVPIVPFEKMMMVTQKLLPRIQARVGQGVLRTLVTMANGDLRYMMHQMELWRGQTIPDVPVDSLAHAVSEMTYFDLTNYLFCPQRTTEKQSMEARDIHRKKSIQRRNQKSMSMVLLDEDDDHGRQQQVVNIKHRETVDTEYTSMEQRFHKARDHDMLTAAFHTNYPKWASSLEELSMRADLLSSVETMQAPMYKGNGHGHNPTLPLELLVRTAHLGPRRFQRYDFPSNLSMEKEVLTSLEALHISQHSYHSLRETVVEVRDRVGIFDNEDLSFINAEWEDYDAQTSRQLSGRFQLLNSDDDLLIVPVTEARGAT